MCNRNRHQTEWGRCLLSLDNHLILAGKAKTGAWQARISGKMFYPAGGQSLDIHLFQLQLVLVVGSQMLLSKIGHESLRDGKKRY